MQKLAPLHLLVMTFIITLNAPQSVADEIRVAVASNFAETIKVIAQRFEAESGHTVKLVFGSTGKHYAQIMNGAPFNLFFAADARRVKLLEKEGVTVSGSRVTYAIGRLVLWSPLDGYVDPEGEIIEDGGFRYLAIANPKLAPYGKAAQKVLQGRGLWSELRGRMVRGENIGQTFQFVKSGNVELGFVAYSQVKRPDYPVEGALWEVPQRLYPPIIQQAVLLKRGDSSAARAFFSFVQGSEAREIIGEFGYGVP